MGSYNFTWSHPADEVYVTGTFDNWSKTIKLDKTPDVFNLHEKLVNLPSAHEKILYKFVADGNWSHDHTAKTETDHEGNVNNVLYPEDIQPVNSMAHTFSSVAPGASTTEMAGAQPLEKEKEQSSPPGAFPETPALITGPDDEKKDGLAGTGAAIAGSLAAGGAAAAAAVGLTSKKEPEKQEQEQSFSVNPIPASVGAGNPVQLAPGERVPDPSTINSNTIASTVRDDPSLKSGATEADQSVSVAPLPATGGIGNPVHLQPGEKVPASSEITSNTINSNVKLDEASYNKSDAAAPQLAPAAPGAESAVAGGALLGGLGPQTTNMIPESSMGMGRDAPGPLDGAAINSVGTNSTTNQLAGQVPLEPRGVPQVVTDSQKEAGVGAEAAANPEAVQEKKEVEQELKKEVPEEQGGGDSKKSTIAGTVAGGVAAAGAAATGAAVFAREKTKETTGKDPVAVLPESVQKSINEQNATSTSQTSAVNAAGSVPSEVKESQKAAHVAPEASANPEAVHEKSDVERELLAKVPESQATGQPAPATTAATNVTAPAAPANTAATTAPAPAPPTESGAPQLGDPTAGVGALTLDDKPKSGLNAPADSQAQSLAPQTRGAAAGTKPLDSRDVSPMSKPATTAQTAPQVTSGVASGSTAATSTPVGSPRKDAPSTPGAGKRGSFVDKFKNTPESSKTTDSSGKKKGFFSKLKEKLNK